MQRISETKEKSRIFEEKVKRKKQIGGKKRKVLFCFEEKLGKPCFLLFVVLFLSIAFLILSSRDLEECQEKEVELDHRVLL